MQNVSLSHLLNTNILHLFYGFRLPLSFLVLFDIKLGQQVVDGRGLRELNFVLHRVVFGVYDFAIGGGMLLLALIVLGEFFRAVEACALFVITAPTPFASPAATPPRRVRGFSRLPARVVSVLTSILAVFRV